MIFGFGKSDDEKLRTEIMALGRETMILINRVIELKGALLAEKEAHLATESALLEARSELAVLLAQNGAKL